MSYAALTTIQTIATGQPFLAATLQQANDSLEFLINPPACSVYNNTTQTVATGGLTVLTANSETFDNDSMHSTASNTSRITIQTAGRYLLTATVEFATDTDGIRFVEFYENATDRWFGQTIPSNATDAPIVTAVRAVVLSAGDYVECRVRHTAGNDLAVTLREFAALFMTR